ncbi:hypothetical protein EHM92_01020 [bacterium]|nr:MAG: hypothetical protein EHM92_01020 [bacterium]
MRSARSYIKQAFLLILTLFCVRALLQAQEEETREVGRTTENELKVTLTSSFGTIKITRGDPEKMVVVQSSSDEEQRMNMDYSIRNRVGYMDLTLGEGNQEEPEGKKGSFHITDFHAGQWALKFSDAVPISFDIQLGVGKGDFDFSGLHVKDFNLSTGAGDVTLSFDEPNRSTIENMNIESGVSKFEGRNLGNANFKHFRFQEGVGTSTLDFSGGLYSEVDVDVEVGMGVTTIIVPPHVGARVTHDKSWASKLECARDFHSTSDTEYVSENYDDVPAKINIRVDSGLGSIKIRRH